MKFLSVAIAAVSLTSMSFFASAGVITQTTGAGVFKRSCPSVSASFDTYKSKWGEAIAEFGQTYPMTGMPTAAQDLTPEAACIFNTQWEQYYEGAEPGTLAFDEIVSANLTEAFVTSADGSTWLQAMLDNTQLALPEAHFVVSSAEGERISANLFSAQTFLWTGETTTLEFTANFDFSMSTSLWGPDQDSSYNIWIGAATDMVFTEDGIFPSDWGNSFAEVSYSSIDDETIVDDSIYYRDISVSFTVNEGDQFNLYTGLQAFAMNGGWVDSANTMRSDLTIEGLTKEQSEEVFASSLQVVSVSEPGTIALCLMSLMFVARRFCRQG